MQPAINGNIADIGDVALRNIRIRAEQTGYAVPPGSDVELALMACNQSPVSAANLLRSHPASVGSTSSETTRYGPGAS